MFKRLEKLFLINDSLQTEYAKEGSIKTCQNLSLFNIFINDVDSEIENILIKNENYIK